MQLNNSARVGEHFDKNWERYMNNVKANMLHHAEMFAKLKEVIQQHFHTTPVSLVDLGCGDSSAIAPTLAQVNIKQYIGVDMAKHLIETAAPLSMAAIDCDKIFICDDMAAAVKHLNAPVDVIVCSYALHHLSHPAKIEFVRSCYAALKKEGVFILIDGVLAKDQTREAWLHELGERFRLCNPDVTEEMYQLFLEHPRKDDHPEPITLFKQTATLDPWQSFDVLIDKGMFAFMVFVK